MDIENLFERIKVNKKDKLLFDLENIQTHLINDLDYIRQLMIKFNYNPENLLYDEIDLYTFILILVLSNDERTSMLKKYIIYIVISYIKELNNPEISIDKAKAIYYKKGINIDYSYKKKQRYSMDKNSKYTFRCIVEDDIKNSLDMNIIRQII